MSFISHFPLPVFLEKQADNPQFQQKCHAHHIAGLLYGIWPQHFHQAFYKDTWKRQWQQNEVHLQVLEDLKNQEFSPVLLKGMAIFSTYYPQSGCRFMSDIDLLIPVEQLQSYTAHLSQNGFTIVNKNSWKADQFKSVWEKDIKNTKVFIELHTKLFYHTDKEDWSYLNSSVQGYQVLSKEDQFLHLLGHAGFQHTFSKLYWIFDIYFFIIKESKNLNWDLFFQKSKKLKLNNSSLASLFIIQEYFNVELNAYLEKKLKTLPALLRDQLTKDFLWQTEQWGLKYFTCKHLLKDSLAQAFKYDLLWFLNKIKKNKEE